MKQTQKVYKTYTVEVYNENGIKSYIVITHKKEKKKRLLHTLTAIVKLKKLMKYGQLKEENKRLKRSLSALLNKLAKI